MTEALVERMATATPDDLPALSKAIETLGNKGGYLDVDKLVHAEVERRRSVLDIIESPALNQEQKDRFLSDETKREQEVLGEMDLSTPNPKEAA